MSPMSRASRCFFTATALVVLGFVTSLAASRSNHTDVRRRAPHYTGKAPPAEKPIGHLTVRLGAFADSGLEQRILPAVEDFLSQCDRFLDSLAVTRPIRGGADPDSKDAPYVYVGDPNGFYAPVDVLTEEELERQGREAVLIHVSDPPTTWKKTLGVHAGDAAVEYVLYVAFNLSDYPVAQKNWKGSKAVEMGTGAMLAVPWLTSLDQPAEVLQFIGVLYRADGRFVRAGAEAFHAQRTPFRQSILDLQRTMSRQEVEAAFETRRSDLPGEPLAWQVALRNLVGQLTGRADVLLQPAGE